MKKILAIVAMTLGLMSVPAQAALLKWTLNDVVFNVDGPGSISGSFVYNDETEIYSDILLTIAGTGTLLDGLYTEAFSVSSSSFIAAKTAPIGVGSAAFELQAARTLTFQGGTIPVLSAEAGFCSDADCNILDPSEPQRFGTTGTITAPIPLPATGLMLLGALGGVAGLRRLKRN